MAERLSAAEALARALAAHGIRNLYCLPGVQNDPFFDALYRRRDEIRAIHTRHEQAAAYMALGAALASGRPQAFCVVPGPGFLNTGAALATAYACNAQLLALVGQIPSGSIGRGLGLLHEIPDQLGMLRALTKWAERVSGAQEAAALAAEAFRRMASGRPRPVGLEVPMDVWSREADVTTPPPLAIEEPKFDEDAIGRAAKLLGAAERPLVMVGGGAQDASAEVRAVAEMLQAPVGAYRGGRGVLDSRHPLSVNLPLAHRFWAGADAVLAVGTRLQQPQQVWGVDDGIKIVRIDADAEELNRVRAPQVGIVGRAAPALKKLIDALPRHNRKRDRTGEIRALKDEMAATFAQRLAPQLAFLESIRAELPEEGIFVDELTQIGYASRLALPVYRPRTFLSSGYQGTLGWGYPAALGAKVERPHVPVLSVAGDGGFLFNAQELASAVRHRIAVVCVVFADGAYGNVRMLQQENFGGRLIAADLVNPDFVKLAESFGVAARRASTPAELGGALRWAFALGAPALIEVPCAEMPSPWPFIQLPRARAPS